MKVARYEVPGIGKKNAPSRRDGRNTVQAINCLATIVKSLERRLSVMGQAAENVSRSFHAHREPQQSTR
jgi:hypothetical protein